MARVLLLLPTSTYRATDFIDAAQTLGAEVVVGSNEEQALADAMGAHALELDFDDPRAAAEAVVDNCREMPVDAVVAVDDQGVLTAALAAERLGTEAQLAGVGGSDARQGGHEKGAYEQRRAAAGVRACQRRGGSGPPRLNA